MDEVIQIPKKAKAAKIIAIIVFSLIMSLLVAAILSDVLIFTEQIGAFIEGIIGASVTFILGCILMVASFALIFGLFIVKNEGFWPGKWASDVYHDAINKSPFTEGQINTLVALRIVFLVLCVIGITLSIIALSLAKSAQKKNPDIKQKLTKPFSIISLIFSILGFLAALFIILLIKLIN